MVLGLIRLMSIPDPTQGIFRSEGAGEEKSLCCFLFSHSFCSFTGPFLSQRTMSCILHQKTTTEIQNAIFQRLYYCLDLQKASIVALDFFIYSGNCMMKETLCSEMLFEKQPFVLFSERKPLQFSAHQCLYSFLLKGVVSDPGWVWSVLEGGLPPSSLMTVEQ